MSDPLNIPALINEALVEGLRAEVLRLQEKVAELEEHYKELVIENIASVCHEVNRAYCQALGDHSQPSWKDAPEWQRLSAVNGVKFIQSHPDALPSASHESWLAEKTRDGWTYGPVKNPELKQHPCFVSYDQLPVEQKAKDYIFGAIVRVLTH